MHAQSFLCSIQRFIRGLNPLHGIVLVKVGGEAGSEVGGGAGRLQEPGTTKPGVLDTWIQYDQ